MEPSGGLPPDRDNNFSSQLQHSNTNVSQNQPQTLPSSPAFIVPTASSTTSIQQQSLERLSRPMAFDKVNANTPFLLFIKSKSKTIFPLFFFCLDGNIGERDARC